MKSISKVVRAIENINKTDLRSVKTDKALDVAMCFLLNGRNFRKITVNDICAEALVSRAAFYARYADKYEFLKNWLGRVCPQNLRCSEPYEHLEKIINEFAFKNKAVIKNIVSDADSGTQDVLLQIIMPFLNFEVQSGRPGEDEKQPVLHNIYAGGVISYICWQVKNNFPENVKVMNKHLYKALEGCRDVEPE